ncbi:unnamed protein product [Mycena citricolor]|uniref:Uncharacterized protein n=1 Tax=Mycena citricolor TaxID=2018698 RepID=A0AAD2JYQ3_9AGAR|nr:unnamed protein product [Mycena citricolor]
MDWSAFPFPVNRAGRWAPVLFETPTSLLKRTVSSVSSCSAATTLNWDAESGESDSQFGFVLRKCSNLGEYLTSDPSTSTAQDEPAESEDEEEEKSVMDTEDDATVRGDDTVSEDGSEETAVEECLRDISHPPSRSATPEPDGCTRESSAAPVQPAPSWAAIFDRDLTSMPRTPIAAPATAMLAPSTPPPPPHSERRGKRYAPYAVVTPSKRQLLRREGAARAAQLKAAKEAERRQALRDYREERRFLAEQRAAAKRRAGPARKIEARDIWASFEQE